MIRRKTTKLDIQNAMDSDSKISLPKIASRIVDNRGSKP